jgi:hypothetical protein
MFTNPVSGIQLQAIAPGIFSILKLFLHVLGASSDVTLLSS